MMAYRKSTLKLTKQGVAINADIRTAKLSAEDVVDTPDVIRRDAESGELVVNQLYDKATDEPLEEGYGYRYVTESGDEVPKENIEYYHVDDGEEKRFTLYDPTFGGERTVSPFTWIPVATVDQYLVDRTYELWGEEDEDVAQLLELAELIRDYEEVPVVEVVFQPSRYKHWGMITPQFFEDEFALIMRITREKIVPEHRMTKVTKEELEERAAKETDESPKLEQESPFS